VGGTPKTKGYDHTIATGQAREGPSQRTPKTKGTSQPVGTLKTRLLVCPPRYLAPAVLAVAGGPKGRGSSRAPNQALEPTPYSFRCAPAFGRGSPRALGLRTRRPGQRPHNICEAETFFTKSSSDPHATQASPSRSPAAPAAVTRPCGARRADRRSRGHPREGVRGAGHDTGWAHAASGKGRLNFLYSLLIRMEYTGFEDYWQPLICEGPGRQLIAQLSAPARLTLTEHVRRAYGANRPDGPRSFACVAWAVKGTVPG
jgi:hypothetical protein